MNRRLIGLAATLALVAGMAVVSNTTSSSADPTPAFEATFDTASDFYNRFDMGYSGLVNQPMQIHGDHSNAMPCGGPTTDRTVTLTGGNNNLDFSQAFWWCAPNNDPALGHVMTGLDTLGYNIVWFSPKPTFTAVTKVCWDINATYTSDRKWTQVTFVSASDAARFPSGTPTTGSGFNSFARGSGGFDLGFPNPDHRTGAGPSTGIDPIAPIGGIMSLNGSASWFDNATWTSLFNGPIYHGEPQLREQTTDKAARFTNCVEQTGPDTITYTKMTPVNGLATHQMTGHIPQGAVRVVFEDDEYDGNKGAGYNPNVMTWHWDNIRVYTSGGPPPTTTVATTTVAPTTTIATTTTAAPTTTLPPTTTTTVAPTTTTTSPACPPDFSAPQMSWCVKVNARLHALDGG